MKRTACLSILCHFPSTEPVLKEKVELRPMCLLCFEAMLQIVGMPQHLEQSMQQPCDPHSGCRSKCQVSVLQEIPLEILPTSPQKSNVQDEISVVSRMQYDATLLRGDSAKLATTMGCHPTAARFPPCGHQSWPWQREKKELCFLQRDGFQGALHGPKPTVQPRER
eukprot:Lithocolla_globosa_v1_NODE_1678_length_2402_cov_33.350660.p3 type:complete len:166 gc:universal NODE_1678_length_2402_cov_33.350660:245-742(+)